MRDAGKSQVLPLAKSDRFRHRHPQPRRQGNAALKRATRALRPAAWWRHRVEPAPFVVVGEDGRRTMLASPTASSRRSPRRKNPAAGSRARLERADAPRSATARLNEAGMAWLTPLCPGWAAFGVAPATCRGDFFCHCAST